MRLKSSIMGRYKETLNQSQGYTSLYNWNQADICSGFSRQQICFKWRKKKLRTSPLPMPLGCSVVVVMVTWTPSAERSMGSMLNEARGHSASSPRLSGSTLAHQLFRYHSCPQLWVEEREKRTKFSGTAREEHRRARKKAEREPAPPLLMFWVSWFSWVHQWVMRELLL